MFCHATAYHEHLLMKLLLRTTVYASVFSVALKLPESYTFDELKIKNITIP